MPAVPAALRASFEKWDAEGRPPQDPYAWRAKKWKDSLNNLPMLDTLANPLGRAEVTRWFEHIGTQGAALDAYAASYIWGYAKANFGPFRAARVIAENTDKARDKDFAADLRELARTAQGDGGLDAFERIVRGWRADRSFFKWWGPAFATKFISFATKASPVVDTVPIMDRLVTGWFAEHCREIGPLRLNWHSTDSYRRYTGCMAEWADELSTRTDGPRLEADDVEQIIYTSLPPRPRRKRRPRNTGH